LAEQLEETQTKLEMAVAALQFAREAMGMMSAKYEELYKSYEKAVKHIRKLERKLEKAE
jgi:exonuclease VII small subunit